MRRSEGKPIVQNPCWRQERGPEVLPRSQWPTDSPCPCGSRHLSKYKILMCSRSSGCLVDESFGVRIVSYHASKQLQVVQKRLRVVQEKRLQHSQTLQQHESPAWRNLYLYKAAQISFSDVSVLPSVISGPAPAWGKLQVVHWVLMWGVKAFFRLRLWHIVVLNLRS